MFCLNIYILKFVESNDSIDLLIVALIRLRFQRVFKPFSKEFLITFKYCIFFIRLATLVEINITHFIQKIHLSFYKVQFKASKYVLFT